VLALVLFVCLSVSTVALRAEGSLEMEVEANQLAAELNEMESVVTLHQRGRSQHDESALAAALVEQHAALVHNAAVAAADDDDDDDDDGSVARKLSNRPWRRIPATLMSTSFVSKIQVGSQNQELQAIFDTGSSDISLLSVSTEIPACQVASLACFDASKSASLVSGDVMVEVSFASAIVVNVLGSDTVTVGPLRVERQAVGLIASVQGDVPSSLFGLAFPSLSSFNQSTFMENVDANGLLLSRQFSFFYSNIIGKKSSVKFGEPDERLFDGEQVWLDIDKAYNSTVYSYWQVPLNNVYFGGVPIQACNPNGPCQAILDTGTALLSGPMLQVSAILTALESFKQADGTFSCAPRDLVKMPIVSWDLGARWDEPVGQFVGSYRFDLEPRFYMQYFNGTCLPSFEGDDNLQRWVLGDLFLRKFYTTFDMTTTSRHGPRVGLARSINVQAFQAFMDREGAKARYKGPYPTHLAQIKKDTRMSSWKHAPNVFKFNNLKKKVSKVSPRILSKSQYLVSVAKTQQSVNVLKTVLAQAQATASPKKSGFLVSSTSKTSTTTIKTTSVVSATSAPKKTSRFVIGSSRTVKHSSALAATLTRTVSASAPISTMAPRRKGASFVISGSGTSTALVKKYQLALGIHGQPQSTQSTTVQGKI